MIVLNNELRIWSDAGVEILRKDVEDVTNEVGRLKDFFY